MPVFFKRPEKIYYFVMASFSATPISRPSYTWRKSLKRTSTPSAAKRPGSGGTQSYMIFLHFCTPNRKVSVCSRSRDAAFEKKKKRKQSQIRPYRNKCLVKIRGPQRRRKRGDPLTSTRWIDAMRISKDYFYCFLQQCVQLRDSRERPTKLNNEALFFSSSDAILELLPFHD